LWEPLCRNCFGKHSDFLLSDEGEPGPAFAVPEINEMNKRGKKR
jgi:hypothetical protein